MSGLELAGVVLGGIPVAIWALEKYAEPLETFTNYHIAIQTLKANLQMQYWQLEKTLASVGLYSPTREELRRCFEAKYPDKHRELLFIVQRMEEITAELMNYLSVDIDKKPRWTSEHPERAQWEWRRVKRSFGSKKRDKLVQQLRSWNEDLRNLVEKAEVPAEDDNRGVQKVRMRYNRTECDSMRESLVSLHRAVAACVNCDDDAEHEATIELNWASPKTGTTARRFSLALLHGTDSTLTPESDSWKRFHAAITEDKQSSSEDYLKPMPPPLSPRKSSSGSSIRFDLPRAISSFRKSPKVSPKVSPRLHARIDSNATLVEPVQTLDLVKSKSAESTTSDQPSIENLCEEIEKQRESGEEIGLLHDPARTNNRRFSLSHAPEERPEIVGTIPIKSLLAPRMESMRRDSKMEMVKQDISLPRLSARQRYAIAASVAWAVLHMSGSSWLQDRWDQDQLKIFLEKSARGHETLAPTPSISYLLSSASVPRTLPKDDVVSRSIPNKLIFALGILLIELGINEGFGVDSLGSILTEDPSDLRNKLDDVYREAGDSYGYAAQRCVRFDFQGQTSQMDFELPKFRQQFHDTVVAPIQATYEIFASSYDILNVA